MNYRWLTITAIVFFTLFAANDIIPQRHGNNDRHDRTCINRLNLTDAQKEKFNDLHLSHKEKMIQLHSELELKQLDLEKLKSSESFSAQGYVNAAKEISAVESKIAEAKAEHRMDIYEMLDENQKKEFLSFPEHSRKFRTQRYYRHRDM
jgi:Spy/CpxP family protein refolding chaperone